MDAEKKIVDQICTYFALHGDGTVDRKYTGPPEIEFMIKPVPAHDEFQDGISVRDLTVDTNSGLAVRLYIPERKPSDDDDDKLPVIVHFHGGGFCFSEPEWFMYYQFYTRLVRSTGALCVSVKTRLAPEHRLPAAIDDGQAVILWLQEVARGESSESWLKSYADFRRVFLAGDSSGGNLVHQVAAWAGTQDLDPVQLAGCVILHPGFVRAKRSRSELENASDSDFFSLDMIDKILALALPVGSTKDHPYTCPMGSAAPPLAGLKLPPMMVAVAEKDLMYDTQMEYCEAMKKAGGKDIETLVSPGVSHCFYLNKIAMDMDPHVAARSDHLIVAITDFIRRH